MCRHFAYLGPPVVLHDLVFAPPFSLLRQSYAPREQLHGTVNADGFGVGWYPPEPGGPAPLRYRRSMPIWADSSFADAAQAITTGCVVAAVRDATPGFGSDESCAQPFRGEGRLFSHNGAAEDDAALTAELSAPIPHGVLDARTPVDSAPLFAHAVRLWQGGMGTAEAIAEVVRRAGAVSDGRYNLLVSDGVSIAATTWGDTLYVGRLSEGRARGGVVVASEPLDDGPDWRRVPDGVLVTADAEGVRETGLDLGPVTGKKGEECSAPIAT